MIVGTVIGILLGAGAGAAVALVVASSRAAARASAERVAHAAALAASRAEVSALQAALEHERQASRERQAATEEVRRQLVGEFAELSRRALQQNNTQFLELADSRLARAHQSARGDLDQRTQAIEELLRPLHDQLGRYEEGLRRLELDRQGAYSSLSEQVKQLTQSQEKLQVETRNLVTALRSPATRGRWGELQLRRVVEMAGMLEHCDFEEQVTTEGSDGRVRPDMVVHLPGAKQVVVDAKVPLQGFLDANDAVDDDARLVHLQAHARHLRAHVDALAKKAYWQQFDDSPGFVVAFVPGDPLLAAALEHDPTLLEHAVASHVLLATPTTLIALLRTVAYGWQQEALAENAREVQLMARELYKRLATFGEHMARTGRSLSGAVESYNKAVGSLERNVFPQARRFHELGVVGGADKEMPELVHVDAVARDLHAPELAGSRLARPGEAGLELIEGSGEGHRDLPGAAAT
ncbi:MAG TPA: DNA recombination protein RmuC [Acidimicrobiales bacterium]|nr:DNA recombination protein RmuC [Acidimicrobiales bacterium]